MADLTCTDGPFDQLDRLMERNPLYQRGAYVFVLDALHTLVARMGEKRHLSGTELAFGVRDLALHRFGPMALTVLHYWGVRRTQDLGAIVFAMVEIGLLVKQDEDRMEDFEDLFDFVHVFERDYPWSGVR
jgi:uncharacterized repeat protein (TIGR04138 family)